MCSWREMTFEVAKALILAAEQTLLRIELLNAMHQTMDLPQIREVLGLLPTPYNSIKVGYARPRLANTAENRTPVNWLDDRKVISSFGEAFWSDDIVVYLYHRQ